MRLPSQYSDLVNPLYVVNLTVLLQKLLVSIIENSPHLCGEFLIKNELLIVLTEYSIFDEFVIFWVQVRPRQVILGGFRPQREDFITNRPLIHEPEQ